MPYFQLETFIYAFNYKFTDKQFNYVILICKEACNRITSVSMLIFNV